MISTRYTTSGRRLCILALGMLALTSCRRSDHRPVERTWLTMGTFASLTLREDDAASLDQHSTVVQDRFEQLNRTLSVYRPDSEISRLNNTATGMVTVSEATFEMLEEALRYARMSGGAFDPTITPVIRTWGFSGGEVPTALPTADAITAALQSSGYRNVKLSTKESCLAGFARPGMSLDLGGIAKGFAVDLACDALGTKPDLNALVNLGGNIRCLGTATSEREWRIAVRDPFDKTRTVGVLSMPPGMAVATSGNYERFVTIGSRKYAHIIDPRTGYPVEAMAGVTVLSTTATEADAISTALFVVGIEGAADLLARLPTTHAVLIPDRKPMELWVSPGFRDAFTPHAQYADRIHVLPAP